MSEREENPPTLTSLWLSSAKARPTKKPSSPTSQSRPQLGLLFNPEPEPAAANPEPPPATPPAPPERRPQPPIAPPAAPPALERRIWPVRDLVNNIRQHVESTYTDLWVEGEVSNCRPAPSGHVYFTLKDGEAQLPVVMFRRQASLLRFRPADGLAVLVRGRISVYETRGQLQLIAETMEPRGAGALQLAFEQLKARLLAEGLFDAARKRPLPAFPRCIGIITSPTGAVIRDIVNVVRRRHARLNILIYPATMQGANCAPSVIAGLRFFNAHPHRADVLIIARGGGSMEDLSGFNDESLARAIAASTLPVVSAIGHETDFTIADFVSDLRAPTPSAAAELVTAAQHRIEERVAALDRRIHRAVQYHLMHARQRYGRLSADSVLIRLRDAVSRRDQHLDELRLRLESAVARRLRTPAQRLALLTERLRRQDVSLRLADTRHRLSSANLRLLRIAPQVLTQHQNRLSRATARLHALSPLAVLSRGYALAYAEDGTLLHSASQTAPQQNIRVRLGTGSLAARVTTVNIGDNKATEKSNS
jgi:exodeoxyribonuclease VII large subunit